MDLWHSVLSFTASLPARLAEWFTSELFYIQLAALVGACAIAVLVSAAIRRLAARAWPAIAEPGYARLRSLLLPLLLLFFTGVAVALVEAPDPSVTHAWLIRAARSVAFIYLLFLLAANFTSYGAASVLTKWLGIPLATLHVFGLLDDVSGYLDGVSLTVGDIRISLYVLLRTIIFGAVLFWLGRASSNAGKQAIRKQQRLDIGTREVLAKLFEIALFVVVFLLLLQVMGINLTALAVFGGALGVGLGFGLQQIASNFISGLIILLDRSVTIGDYIEMEDGKAGTLRELTMRYGILETFDGKDVMVPNEKFITAQYVNWTHKDPHQRYALELSVAYSTDLDLLFDNIRKTCGDHPQVLSGSEVPKAMRPDAEIAAFGESGIDILVEFWMAGIDDGENRVGADLLHSIWRSIQEHGMQIPFPQREVRIVNPAQTAAEQKPE
ncbi:MAG: mechanosensitive ion channel domain-containing protein [Pseudomonadota bacterium]